MNWQHLYLGLDGRTSRRDFWIGLGGLVAAGFIATLLPLIGGLASVALLYPAGALMAKRLHDFGRSGWLVMVPLVPTALSAAFAMLAGAGFGDPVRTGAGIAALAVAAGLSTLAMLVGLVFLLWIGTRDGDPCANAYGQPAADNPIIS